MKKINLLLILLAVATMAFAKPVPQDKLNLICSHFFGGATTRQLLGNNSEMMLVSPIGAPGFLLLATDDCVRPVLAYSYTGRFDLENMPENIRLWLEGYEHDIAARVAAGEEASPEVADDWQRWIEGRPKSSGNQVNPLMTTRWGQYPYYNAWCPFDTTENDYVMAGCSATAMGQVMKYWNHPTIGMGSHTYNSVLLIDSITYTYDSLSANFGATIYDWAHMPDSLCALSDSLSINAVAQLLYHVGVAMNTNYSPFGSAAYAEGLENIDNPSIENALKYHFKYSQSLRSVYKEEFDNGQWIEMMRNELDMSQPIIYGGYDPNAGGHGFVLDGYDSLGFFHVNWGWKGMCDGFYTIDSLAPQRGTNRYHFSTWCSAVVGIRPMTSVPAVSPVEINMVSSDTSMGIVTGSGIYTALTDTVRILASATEGHRFVRWSSGSLNNPRSFIAMNSITDTAIFERLHEDTMSYCDKAMNRRFSQTADIDWGIRLPSAARYLHKKLTAVQLYVKDAARYELKIYLGDSITDATLAYTQNYVIQSDLYQWHTLVLDVPMNIPDNKILWVTFHVDDSCNISPVTFGRYTGNNDGSWRKNDTAWETMTDNSRSWLIRAIVSTVEKVHVAVSPNDINGGDVLGGGLFWPGELVTLDALPKNGYQFSHWSNGSTDNPLNFIVTCDTAIIAFFESTNGISDIEPDDLVVTLQGRTLIVDNPSALPIALYDIQGREIAHLTSHASSFTLPSAGVYLLRRKEHTRKIVVY